MVASPEHNPLPTDLGRVLTLLNLPEALIQSHPPTH